ncbi:endonuclease NucS [Haloarcula sebkhae]|uniref:Endonuclease NucS n=2 Tax=Haloarcula sebkhae TaxID=932660 RepID=A0ACC6VI95_9EURY|nr:endonuclease NucS [Haloarcula sebkhae]GGK60608.1 endonuclease NucS [Haloarcula sebkhae]
MTAVETLTYPDPADALDLASRNADRGALVTLVGTCTVEYEGRAASSLGPGDRHVMLKPDGAALVHTDEGQQPVNWQPPGCEHSISVDDGSLVVRSTRSSPEELLEVTFETVAHAAAFDVTDSKDLALTGTEADLKDRILDEPALVESGFTPLATERETPAGAVDIYGEDADGRTTILELKRRRVGPDAVGQLGRYVDALERDLHADTEVRGILVAPSVTDRARQLLAEKGLEFVSLEPP